MGEVLGIAGVEGNGQKYLAEAILGLRDYQEGHVSLGGRLLDGLDVAQRKRWGIGYISDDRQQDGLLMDMNLSENMLLRSDRKEFLRHGLLRAQALRTATMDAVHRFAIKTHSVDMPVRLLSGGNQQKLILAREISRDVTGVGFNPHGVWIWSYGVCEKVVADLRDYGVAFC
jgi:simple sugar transport system ATP-binding protein